MSMKQNVVCCSESRELSPNVRAKESKSWVPEVEAEVISTSPSVIFETILYFRNLC